METVTSENVRPFTDAEIFGLVKMQADKLDYASTVEYLARMAEVDEEAVKGGSTIDKILWSVRHAYLDGFRQGIELYNDTLKVGLGGRK